MKKILLVFKREYLTRVRKKSFIIITLLVPLSFLLVMIIPMLLVGYSSESKKIVLKDETGIVTIESKADGSLYIDESTESLEHLRENYQQLGYDGILYVPDLNLKRPSGVKYISDNLLGISSKSHLEREIANSIRAARLKDLGFDTKTYGNLKDIRVRVNEESGQGSDLGSTGTATGVGYLMGILMYMVIFIYGSMVMRGVMEEKTNRIVEVILSSIRPFKLMMGKILGIGAVGLTQFGIWIVLMTVLNIILALFLGGSMDMPSSGLAGEQDMEAANELFESFQATFDELPLGLLIGSFIFYFLGGYIFYAALFAGLASAINDESDAQTLTLPVSIPVIISFFILTAIIESPNSGLAVWSSIIPFFSPIIMPSRIAFGVPPLWELLLSMGMLIAGCIFTVWLAAKIYRVGILMYGKKISFREIGKWLFYKN